MRGAPFCGQAGSSAGLPYFLKLSVKKILLDNDDINDYNVTKMKFTLTLLEKFIQDKLDGYTEPDRRGTPKGEPIGLSKIKYHASLLCGFTNEPLKEIARKLKTSYGVLRNWKLEDEFNSMVKNNLNSFGVAYRERLDERRTQLKPVMTELSNAGDLDILNAKRFLNSLSIKEDLLDIHRYSIPLLNELLRVWGERHYDYSPDHADFINDTYYYVVEFEEYDLIIGCAGRVNRDNVQISKTELAYLFNCLSQKKVSDRQRKISKIIIARRI